MDCSEARPLCDAVIDGAIDEATRAAFQDHLRSCPACLQHYTAARSWSDEVRRHGRAYPVPAGLAARIEAALPQPSPQRLPGWGSGWRSWLRAWRTAWATSLASAGLAAVLAMGLTLWIAAPGERPRLGEEMVAAHVRSLLVDHLTDVASSDQHTVKPWFSGKVGVAPPAKDFAAEGFPLVGGRLDYLDGRPVPVLVYRHRQHVINVFVLAEPTTPKGAADERRLQGYSLVTWQSGGLDFTAVSDVAPADLRRLAALLATPDQERVPRP